MSFSPGQQPAYRQLVEMAWQRHCRANAIALPDKVQRREWYEGELVICTGHPTTTPCNKTEDYETCMAHFEALVGDSMVWQHRKFRGPVKRLLHEIRKLTDRYEIEESYMQRIARSATGLLELPPLHLMNKDILLQVLRAVKIHVRRFMVRDGLCDPVSNRKTGRMRVPRMAAPVEEDNIPF